MAYPNSVTTFTTKSAGQTVDEDHINDLQTEVSALEEGLLNGISHDLNPSTNSTRVLGTAAKRWKTAQVSTVIANRVESTSLTVTGGSTLATLQVTGASTFTGDVVMGNVAMGDFSGSSLTLSGAANFQSTVMTFAGVRMYWATAAPDGNISAPVGSLCFVLNSSEAMWVKCNSTTSTGWRTPSWKSS